MSDEIGNQCGGTPPDSVTSLSEAEIDERLEALANEQRWYLLWYLIAEDASPVRMAAAVDYVADATGELPEDVRPLLYHQHLPRLKSAGLVAYDSDADILSYSGSKLTRKILEPVVEAASPPSER